MIGCRCSQPRRSLKHNGLAMDKPIRVLIVGAAGRDFHNFNVVYRDDPHHRVVAFTATQIPGIAGRRYPPSLAGPGYPEGIPIVVEAELEAVCHEFGIDVVVFAYSDVSHAEVMHIASRALATGADFVLLGPEHTMLRARVPVIAVSAVRTGCGKSQTSRWIARRLRERGLRVAVIRHPMPYGDLERQAVQRFAERSDLAAAGCTLEEREEYEPHLAAGNVVFAGIDYARIVATAEAEADIILWDGGNNHPGEAVLRMADVVLVAKTNAADPANIDRVVDAARRANPRALLVKGASPVRLDDPDAVAGKRVVVVEDGPTTTHGGVPWGAGYAAALDAGVAEIVDPRGHADPEIALLYDRYPRLGPVLPAMGYSAAQLAALVRSIDAVPADVVVSGTPVDLAALASINKPIVRARYEFAEAETPGLGGILDDFLRRRVAYHHA